MVILFIAGCGNSAVDDPASEFEPAPNWADERPPSQQGLEPEPLEDQVFVNAEGFEELTDEATIIDARTKRAYEEGHYPGASHSGNEKGGYKPFKDPSYNDILPREVSTLQEEARRMGIDDDRPVLIYATPGSKRSGRLFWVLEYLGKGEVYIYAPGYTGLRKELDFEPSTEPVEDTGDFVVRRRDAVLATAEGVEQAAEDKNDVVLIDTRRESEFTGEEQRAPRRGHIPGAIFYHWQDVFTKRDIEEGDVRRLRPKDELAAEFREEGLLSSNTVLVPYCQTGTRSGYIYAVLRELEDEVDEAYTPQNYDGSWTQYARIDDTPVAQDGEDRLGRGS